MFFIFPPSSELALTLNGRRKKIKLDDFVQAMQKADISDRVISNIFRRFQKKCPDWEQTIRNSFLPKDYQDAYWQMVCERLLARCFLLTRCSNILIGVKNLDFATIYIQI